MEGGGDDRRGARRAQLSVGVEPRKCLDNGLLYVPVRRDKNDRCEHEERAPLAALGHEREQKRAWLLRVVRLYVRRLRLVVRVGRPPPCASAAMRKVRLLRRLLLHEHRWRVWRLRSRGAADPPGHRQIRL